MNLQNGKSKKLSDAVKRLSFRKGFSINHKIRVFIGDYEGKNLFEKDSSLQTSPFSQNLNGEEKGKNQMDGIYFDISFSLFSFFPLAGQGE